jgi:hypothetical protein
LEPSLGLSQSRSSVLITRRSQVQILPPLLNKARQERPIWVVARPSALNFAPGFAPIAISRLVTRPQVRILNTAPPPLLGRETARRAMSSPVRPTRTGQCRRHGFDVASADARPWGRVRSGDTSAGLAMMPRISSASNARSVVVRTLPCEASARANAVALSSSGASETAMMSYGPDRPIDLLQAAAEPAGQLYPRLGPVDRLLERRDTLVGPVDKADVGRHRSSFQGHRSIQLFARACFKTRGRSSRSRGRRSDSRLVSDASRATLAA